MTTENSNVIQFVPRGLEDLAEPIPENAGEPGDALRECVQSAVNFLQDRGVALPHMTPEVIADIVTEGIWNAERSIHWHRAYGFAAAMLGSDDWCPGCGLPIQQGHCPDKQCQGV